jgi:hypothetical protein
MARVLRERTEGKTAYAIARDLNKLCRLRGVRTPGRKLRFARCACGKALVFAEGGLR